MIEWFKKFVIINKNEFTDFECVSDDSEPISKMVGSNKLNNLVPLLMHGSGSVFCIWKIHPNTSIEEQPVVWLDSEAFPISVCCCSFKEFLSILEYGGALAGIMADVGNWLESGKQNSFALRLSDEGFHEILKKNNSEYPYLKDFVNVIKKNYKTETSKNPYELIVCSIEKEPNFAEWLTLA